MAKIRPEDIAEVARIFNLAVEIGQGHRATQIVAQAFGCNRTTAWRHVTQAREQGLIATSDDTHYPRRVRWTDGSASWSACVECRHPWPCPSSTNTTNTKEA